MPREGEVRIPSGCAIAGVFNKDARKTSGEDIARAIATMHERSNGLGGGFAGYGIYEDFADCYAFHLFYESLEAKKTTEAYLYTLFSVQAPGEIPTEKRALPPGSAIPLIYRYFLKPLPARLADSPGDEKDFVAVAAMHVNANIRDAFVFSCGKNMGVFKGVGYPEDIAEFFCIDRYKGYCWTSHGRYPTNTPGWWGGAHPFALLDQSLVHNGEISSYDANRRFVEMFGYKCTLLTDTEALCYILDYLTRKQGLTLSEAAEVIAAPFWSTIETLVPEDRARITYLRDRFSSLLVTGPFSVIYAFSGGMMALNDRLKLRSMVYAEDEHTLYVSSEECGLKSLNPDITEVHHPVGGEPVIAMLAGKEAMAI